MILNSIMKVKCKGKFDVNAFSKDLEEFANFHANE